MTEIFASAGILTLIGIGLMVRDYRTAMAEYRRVEIARVASQSRNAKPTVPASVSPEVPASNDISVSAA